MALAVKSSGTLSTTLDTDHNIFTTTDPGIYVLLVDLNDLAVNSGTGEVVEIWAEEKVLSGGTKRKSKIANFQAGTLIEKIARSIAFTCPYGIDFYIRQPTVTSATTASLPWRVDQVDG